MTETIPPPNETETSPPQSRWTLTRVATVGAIALIAVILIPFLIALLLALSAGVENTAAIIQVVRDLFIIALVFQGILIVAALAILIVQVARLINLLQNEVMPILKNTQDTVTSAKGTVEFVGSNLAEPVLRLNGFMAALTVILRDLFGIRRAIRRDPEVIHEDEGEN